MGNLVRFFNQNRKTIIIVVIVVISIFIMLGIANDYLRKSNEEKNKNAYNEIQKQIKESNTGVKNQDFDLSGTKKSNSTLKSDRQVIEQFVKYCNDNDIENAYNMLTDECKESLYPKENSFKKDYFSKMFDGDETEVIIESWNDSTYLVKFQTDILAKGKVSEDGVLTDYITITNVNGEKKLNISGYIKRVNIKYDNEYSNLNLKINYKDVYLDYEIYNITFKNNTLGKILIDDLKEANSIYIEDKNGAKYSAYNNELSSAELLIGANGENTVSIKFSNMYRTNKKIEKMVFSNIIYNYKETDYKHKVTVELK